MLYGAPCSGGQRPKRRSKIIDIPKANNASTGKGKKR